MLKAAISQVRFNLRDLPISGIDPQYTDGQISMMIADALSRMYRTKREAFFGVPDAPGTIERIREAFSETSIEAPFLVSNSPYLTIELPLVSGTNWIGYVKSSATVQGESVNQEGTNLPAAVNQAQEEMEQG